MFRPDLHFGNKGGDQIHSMLLVILAGAGLQTLVQIAKAAGDIKHRLALEIVL